MPYRVIGELAYAIEYNETRDKPAGVRGVLMKGNDYLPVGAALEGVLCDAESFEQAMALATAWRDAHPDKTVYVCDDQHRVAEIVWRTDHSKERAAEALAIRKWFGIGLAGVLVLNVVVAAALVFFKHRPILPAIAAIAALELLYVGLVKLKMVNEIEGIHVTVIVCAIVWGVLAFV